MGIENLCECQARVELAFLQYEHPRMKVLKPIMREIAVSGWPLIDWTKSMRECYMQLFREAKKIQKERQRASNRS